MSRNYSTPVWLRQLAPQGILKRSHEVFIKQTFLFYNQPRILSGKGLNNPKTADTISEFVAEVNSSLFITPPYLFLTFSCLCKAARTPWLQETAPGQCWDPRPEHSEALTQSLKDIIHQPCSQPWVLDCREGGTQQCSGHLSTDGTKTRCRHNRIKPGSPNSFQLGNLITFCI